MAQHRKIILEIEDHTGGALDPRDSRPILVTAVDARTDCELWTADGATLADALRALADQLKLTPADLMTRMTETARLLLAEGETEQHAMDYLAEHYGVSEQQAQLATLECRPGGAAEFFAPPTP